MTSFALCFAAYGGWGLADRARAAVALRGNQLLSGSLEALCTLLAGLGVLAVAAVLLSVWAIALGTWIS